jgi:hypothetical protein
MDLVPEQRSHSMTPFPPQVLQFSFVPRHCGQMNSPEPPQAVQRMLLLPLQRRQSLQPRPPQKLQLSGILPVPSQREHSRSAMTALVSARQLTSIKNVDNSFFIGFMF